LEWAEDLILEREGQTAGDARVELRDHPILAGIGDADFDAVASLLVPRRYDAGDLVMRAGAPADEMLLLGHGRVSTLVSRPDGTSRRLATFGAGSLVGELALLSDEPRMVDVRADSDLECHALSIDAMARIGELRPEVRVVLLGNLLRIVAALADRMRDELGLLGD
jgi:glutaminase